MSSKFTLIIILLFVNLQSKTHFDVPTIINTLSHIPLSQRTEDEKSLLFALRGGFEFYQGWLKDYLMLNDIGRIAEECQSIPPELMAYLLEHLSLDRKGIAYCCPYQHFDEGDLCQDYATISEDDVYYAQLSLDRNSQNSCESCVLFKKFLAQQKERGIVRRISEEKLQADQQRKVLSQLFANSKEL